MAARTACCWAQTGAPAQRRLQLVPASLLWGVSSGREGLGQGRWRGPGGVTLSWVPVQEAEAEADEDERALKREVRELRGRLERLELVRLGARGQTPVGRGHSPSPRP